MSAVTLPVRWCSVQSHVNSCSISEYGQHQLIDFVSAGHISFSCTPDTELWVKVDGAANFALHTAESLCAPLPTASMPTSSFTTSTSSTSTSTSSFFTTTLPTSQPASIEFDCSVSSTALSTRRTTDEFVAFCNASLNSLLPNSATLF